MANYIRISIDYKENKFLVNDKVVNVGDKIQVKNGDFKSWGVVEKDDKEVFFVTWERSKRKTSLEDVFNYYDILKIKEAE